jgi:hypothetical protein
VQLFSGQDRHLVGSKRLATWSSERDTPDEASANQPGIVGRKGKECVSSRTASLARGVVLDPQDGARQFGEAGREAIPDHLGGQPLDHLGTSLLG